METPKLHIEKNTIQETLVIPLYARKLCSRLYPSLFSDPAASALIDRLDYDFQAVEKQSSGLMQRFGALEIAMRQIDLAAEIQEYLASHPKAAVVNLGCGLDQTGENCDNGTCKIYNIDMPDVIAVRDQLIPASDRVVNIACNLTDSTWFSQVDSSEGSVFFASGVVCYLQTEDAKNLFNQMALTFPGGKLVFDTFGKTALKIMLKTYIKQAGIQNIDGYFYVGNIEKDIRPWMQHAEISYKGYMFGYHDLQDPSVPGFFRFLSHIGDSLLKMKILRLDFQK